MGIIKLKVFLEVLSKCRCFLYNLFFFLMLLLDFNSSLIFGSRIKTETSLLLSRMLILPSFRLQNYLKFEGTSRLFGIFQKETCWRMMHMIDHIYGIPVVMSYMHLSFSLKMEVKCLICPLSGMIVLDDYTDGSLHDILIAPIHAYSQHCQPRKKCTSLVIFQLYPSSLSQ